VPGCGTERNAESFEKEIFTSFFPNAQARLKRYYAGHLCYNRSWRSKYCFCMLGNRYLIVVILMEKKLHHKVASLGYIPMDDGKLVFLWHEIN